MTVKGRRKTINDESKVKKDNTTHNGLVEKGKKWLKSQNGKGWSCKVTFGELVTVGSEIPDNWGLIYINEKGRAKLIVKPKWQKTNYKNEHSYMYSIIRRLFYAKDSKEIQAFFRRYT